jgi:amino acid transporter
VGEYKDPVKDTVKAAWTSGITVTVFYTIVAIALVGVLGVKGFAENPDYPFFILCEAALGGAGAKFAMLILCLGLFMMANTSFNGTARILYGMSMDGLNITQWLKLSPNGFPWVAALFNIGVTFILLSFELPVRIIAASNLAYMICIFMPIFAFIILRKTRPDHPRPYKLHNAFVPIAWFLGILYVVIIIPGAILYGFTVMLTGCIITLGIVPLYLYRSLVQDKRAG